MTSIAPHSVQALFLTGSNCMHWHAFSCTHLTSKVHMLRVESAVQLASGCLASVPDCDSDSAFVSVQQQQCLCLLCGSTHSFCHCCRNGNIMIREPPQGSLSLEELRKKIIELLFKHLVSPSVPDVKKPALQRLGQS